MNCQTNIVLSWHYCPQQMHWNKQKRNLILAYKRVNKSKRNTQKNPKVPQVFLAYTKVCHLSAFTCTVSLCWWDKMHRKPFAIHFHSACIVQILHSLSVWVKSLSKDGAQKSFHVVTPMLVLLKWKGCCRKCKQKGEWKLFVLNRWCSLLQSLFVIHSFPSLRKLPDRHNVIQCNYSWV